MEQIQFAPNLPLPVLLTLLAITVLALVAAGFAGLRGWVLRAGAAALVLFALFGPVIEQEERDPLDDIIVVIVDDSASQTLAGRAETNAAALAMLDARFAGRDNMQFIAHKLSDLVQGDAVDTSGGTLLLGAMRQAISQVPSHQIAAVFLITDGVVHDPAQGVAQIGAPVHSLLTGKRSDWDRRLTIREAPAFGILGETVEIQLRVDALGPVPDNIEYEVLMVSRDGAEPRPEPIPVGQDVTLQVELKHAGRNLVYLNLPAIEGELTARNNEAVIEINGVRDRLRVLLVTGTPHPGTRSWRNLLKSDGAVDLVHFTILRPPEKQDGVPVHELSLIAFPTRELFIEKIDEFDLIIFDRYQLRGILPGGYLESVRDYVDRGGAVLVAAGPSLASADSIARSVLADILPGTPTGRLVEDAFRPTPTDLGARHPVTRDLIDRDNHWGAWMRWVELDQKSGHTLMSGPDEGPLLMLDRFGAGRVALLASDQGWLWARGHDGGGPQTQLMRRLAHWLMKEPELEEEALWATPTAGGFSVTRQSLGDGPLELEVLKPDGTRQVMDMADVGNGLFTLDVVGQHDGLYHIRQGDQSAVAVRGQTAPREFHAPLATPDILLPVIAPTGGTAWRLEEGLPTLRAVSSDRAKFGRGWLGYTPRDAYETLEITRIPLAPPWLMLVLSALMLVGAWLVEGRRARRD